MLSAGPAKQGFFYIKLRIDEKTEKGPGGAGPRRARPPGRPPGFPTRELQPGQCPTRKGLRGTREYRERGQQKVGRMSLLGERGGWIAAPVATPGRGTGLFVRPGAGKKKQNGTPEGALGPETGLFGFPPFACYQYVLPLRYF